MIRIATLNLLHFAEPPIWWYRREADGSSRYDDDAWAAKCAWLRAELAAINADVIGFQEVVSIEALRALCAEAGYPYFFAAGEPAFLDEPQAVIEARGPVYDRPVQALAARHPFTAEAFGAPPGFAASSGLAPDWSLRRPAVKALVDLPGIGEALVYCCHLKSMGIRTDGTLAPLAAMQAASRAHAAALHRRALEASALMHEASNQIEQAHQRPVIVMGDFNDLPDTVPLTALSPRPPRDIAGIEREDWPEALRLEIDRYRLRDSYHLAPRSPFAPMRPATHREGSAVSVLDYIFVSYALDPESPNAVGHLREHRVYDAHFRAAIPEQSSDHAAVAIAIAPLD
ncbi:MAG: endonuclease/exonuclease/phosphatase family protein [Neomegalonema sp.]|nr:endonuclease/exonuclease/phosphatase family protein [Neomegalonema sp.]